MQSIIWKISDQPIAYPRAIEFMESQVAGIQDQSKPEMVWLLEHPPLYTAGTSAEDKDLLDAGGFPVYKTGRGGQFTYHGPGQRVGYVMLNLKQRNPDVRQFVCQLEDWIIDALDQFGIKGERRAGRVGIWVIKSNGREEKIAAIGVRVRRWVTYHGIALNVHPDLSHFQGIVPCGLNQFGVTSLHDLGVDVSMAEVDKVLQQSFERVFG